MWCLRASHCVPEAVNTSVYDNNCSLAQTHTSCTVWPFAPETSGAEPFPAPVGLGPALRPLVSSPRHQSNSLTLTHTFLHSVCLSVLSFRGGTRGGVAYRGGSRTDGGQFAGPQRWRGDRHPSSFFTPRIDKHKSCLQMKGNSCSNWCFFLCVTGWQEEDNRVFLSTLTRAQAAAVERRMASFQQTLRRRNRQHVPDVRDIFRAPDKVHTGT